MKDGSGALAVAVLVVLALAVAGGAVLIGGPSDRAQADARRIQAEAVAYQVRTQAETQAEAERAATRQVERDAAHQRALETLPFVVVLAGGAVCLVLLIVVAWDLRQARASGSPDPALLFYMARLHLDQAQRDRDLWRAIATLDRRSLPAGSDRREVVEDSHRQR